MRKSGSNQPSKERDRRPSSSSGGNSYGSTASSSSETEVTFRSAVSYINTDSSVENPDTSFGDTDDSWDSDFADFSRDSLDSSGLSLDSTGSSTDISSTSFTSAESSGSSASSVGGGGPAPRAAELRPIFYYHGLLTRFEAEQLLKFDGDYLLRTSDVGVGAEKKRAPVTVLSLRWRHHFHYLLTEGGDQTTAEGAWWSLTGRQRFASVAALVEYYKSTSCTRHHKTRLVYAVPKQKWQLRHENVEMAELIGEGPFGQVFKARLLIGEPDKKTAEQRFRPVAVKTLRSAAGPDSALSKDERNNFMAEHRACSKIRHENVIRVLGVAVEREPLLLVMELADGGSLLNYLRAVGPNLGNEHLCQCAIEVAQGMRCLEKLKFVHRNLAARSCLLDKEVTVKIAGFGLCLSRSQRVQLQEPKGAAQFELLPIKWMAPETLRDRTHFNSKTDIWSFGILVCPLLLFHASLPPHYKCSSLIQLFEIFSKGQQPYPSFSKSKKQTVWTNERTMEEVVGGFKHLLPSSGGWRVKKVMTACLAANPNERPTFLQLKKKLRKCRDEFLGKKKLTKVPLPPTSSANTG